MTDEVKVVSITANDLREASREAGYDPERWYVVKKSDGYHIQLGFMSVGRLYIEDLAQRVCSMLNEGKLH